MTDRDALRALARAQPEMLPSELATACFEGSPLLRTIGMLVREQEATALALFNGLDIISDEGRLGAIALQGKLRGRAELIENLLDLILQGAENVDRERSPAGGTSEPDAEPGTGRSADQPYPNELRSVSL